ncbi:MAG: acyl carrier protein [Thaumarchaeota archaeon]|nr:acyl carrier protein [Nitrososphaerota archaeon]
MTKKLYKIISEVMSVPASMITDQSGPENIENWDSFHGLVLVEKLENEFNVKFTLDEVIDVKKVADIKRHLKNHKVILDE